jgi:hypothetical protein
VNYPQDTWVTAPAWFPCKFRTDIKYDFKPMVYSVLAENAVNALDPKPDDSACRTLI